MNLFIDFIILDFFNTTVQTSLEITNLWTNTFSLHVDRHSKWMDLTVQK